MQGVTRFAVLVFLLSAALVYGQVDGKVLVLRNITVIDTAEWRPRGGMTVVISGTRIADVGASVRIPAQADVVDATGKFLIPGLWDMHTHLVGIPGIRDFTNPLLVANGITGVRNLGQDPLSRVLERKAQIEKDGILGPRIVTSGQMLDGPYPVWPYAVPIRSLEDGRRLVDEQKKSQADFIKVYTLLPRDEFLAIADEAKKQNIPLVGHVPLAVSATEASDAGMRSMEHLHGVLYEASARRTELLAKSAAMGRAFTDERSRAPKADHTRQLVPFLQLEIEAAESYNPAAAAEIFKTLKKNNTWQTPTLATKRDWAFDDDSNYASDQRYRYLPYERPRLISTLLSPTELVSLKAAFTRELAIVRDIHRAGLQLLAGTDGPAFWLADELELLVKAGLAPAEALKTATVNPAEFLGRASDFGSVTAGKPADLVLLDANPLQDIGAIRRINAVVFNGKLHTRSDLDAILTDLAARASAARAKAN